MEKEPLIDPIPLEVLKSELTPDRTLRDTNKGHNEIYVVNWQNAPNTLREIGRLRELTFRAAGGGAGVACDIDELDLMEKPFQQIIVWDPDAEAIRQVVDKGHSYRIKKVNARLAFLDTTFGFRFPEKELQTLFAMDNPGKPHIANLMVKYGFAVTKEKAIKDYINQLHFRKP